MKKGVKKLCSILNYKTNYSNVGFDETLQVFNSKLKVLYLLIK